MPCSISNAVPGHKTQYEWEQKTKLQAKVIHPAMKFNMRYRLVRGMTLSKTKVILTGWSGIKAIIIMMRKNRPAVKFSVGHSLVHHGLAKTKR